MDHLTRFAAGSPGNSGCSGEKHDGTSERCLWGPGRGELLTEPNHSCLADGPTARKRRRAQHSQDRRTALIPAELPAPSVRRPFPGQPGVSSLNTSEQAAWDAKAKAQEWVIVGELNRERPNARILRPVLCLCPVGRGQHGGCGDWLQEESKI